MKVIEIYIPGKFQAKQRPRFNKYTMTIYTPRETTTYENWIKQCFINKYKDFELMTESLAVEIIADFKIPENKSKTIKSLMAQDRVRPTIKPDTDNIAKTILDALNGVAYVDDKQVTQLSIKKRYSKTPGVNVIIWEYDKEGG